MTSLAKAINGLSLTLYKQLSNEEGNVFYSPFSISTALSMLFSGSRGQTEKEMREVLHFESVGISNSEVHQNFDQLLSEFSKHSDGLVLTFANAILSQKGLPILPEFKETVANNYRSLLMEVNFAEESSKAVEEINQWVKKNTNQLIESIVDSLEPATVMVLLNAIYFKGLWKYPFDVKCTRPKTFYNNGSRDLGIEVPMMFINKKFGFVEKETYKALELPYKNDSVVMLLLLPKELDGLIDLENQLTVEFLTETINALHSRKVDVTLPKFSIEYTKCLSETLIKLGMSSAFGGCADFSGVTSTKICISEVISKSVLIVNEEGSEAAAVTAVMMNRLAMVYNDTFEADHPFICAIYDKEKQIVLFIGKVSKF